MLCRTGRRRATAAPPRLALLRSSLMLSAWFPNQPMLSAIRWCLSQQLHSPHDPALVRRLAHHLGRRALRRVGRIRVPVVVCAREAEQQFRPPVSVAPSRSPPSGSTRARVALLELRTAALSGVVGAVPFSARRATHRAKRATASCGLTGVRERSWRRDVWTRARAEAAHEACASKSACVISALRSATPTLRVVGFSVAPPFTRFLRSSVAAPLRGCARPSPCPPSRPTSPSPRGQGRRPRLAAAAASCSTAATGSASWTLVNAMLGAGILACRTRSCRRGWRSRRGSRPSSARSPSARSA